ncbi:MAG: PmoA family protein [Planctomycetales bacterium]|nr:PmoA family protein [Planctomycetales bacterium]
MNGILRTALVVVSTGLSLAAHGQTAAREEVSFVPQTDEVVEVRIGNQPVAVYHATDDKITRPFFSDLRTLDGRQVTRRHPPDPKRDLADHPEFHPGLWMAFGNISGADYWRNKDRVVYSPLSHQPEPLAQDGEIHARYSYLTDRRIHIVCEEDFRGVVLPQSNGWLLLCDSTFTSDAPCEFGDQEEMGLGIRLATEMRSEARARGDIPPGNGRILDAQGRVGADQIWGQSAAWCDYSGQVNGQPAGIAIFCHPDNFRPSWWHARDYGLLVANPFGRAAMHQGEPSRVTVGPDKPLRLRYGVWVHGALNDEARDLQQAYDRYVQAANQLDDAANRTAE